MGWGTVLLIWVLFGVTSAIVAGSRGRTGCGWATMGFLFGPFGLLLVLALPANTAALEKWDLEGGSLKKCPLCAELVKRAAIKCKHCGGTLPDPGPKEPSKLICNAPSQQVMGKMVAKCSCGHNFVYPAASVGENIQCPGCRETVSTV